MKTITLHPVSVLLGAALVGLSLVLTGAAQTSWIAQPLPRPEVRLVGEIPAEWWTYVELTPSQSFTVPASHHLVVTAQNGTVFADGMNQGQRLSGVYVGIQGVTRVPFAPGTVLTTPSGNAGFLWGYLEPVR